MPADQHPSQGDGRRRRLDELFADEPFLSPTMKARRLHDKMTARRVGESPPDPLAQIAYVPRPAQRPAPAAQPSYTIAQAAAELRAADQRGAGTDPVLQRLAHEVLASWHGAVRVDESGGER